MRNAILVIFTGLILFTPGISAQSNPVKYYIIQIEGNTALIDAGSSIVKTGYIFKVEKKGELIIHPVTGKEIKKDNEVVAILTITELHTDYSAAVYTLKDKTCMITAGMEVTPVKNDDAVMNKFKHKVALLPFIASSAPGGYMGLYVSDMLTQELFNSQRISIIDRQTIGFQEDELARQSAQNTEESIIFEASNSISNVDYFITGNIHEPDVRETETGIPIKGILSVAEAVSNTNLGSNLASDMRVTKLKAIVSITIRVVNAKTGEIMFICNEMQQSEGKGEINLEQGALGGMKLQGGATRFMNTITGQATRLAIENLGYYLKDYFEGRIKEKSYKGNVIDFNSGNKTTSHSKKDLKIPNDDKSSVSNSIKPSDTINIQGTVNNRSFKHGEIISINESVTHYIGKDERNFYLNGALGEKDKIVRGNNVYVFISNDDLTVSSKNASTNGETCIGFVEIKIIEQFSFWGDLTLYKDFKNLDKAVLMKGHLKKKKS